MNLVKIIFSLLVSLAISFCFIGEICSAEEIVGNISYERGVIKTANGEDSLAEDGYMVKYIDEEGNVIKDMDDETYDREGATDVYKPVESEGDLKE